MCAACKTGAAAGSTKRYENMALWYSVMGMVEPTPVSETAVAALATARAALAATIVT